MLLDLHPATCPHLVLLPQTADFSTLVSTIPEYRKFIRSMNTCQRTTISRVKPKVDYTDRFFVSVSCAHSVHSARLVSRTGFTRMGAAAAPCAGEADRGTGTASLRVHG